MEPVTGLEDGHERYGTKTAMKSPDLGISSSPVRKLTLLYVSALTSIAAMAIVGQVLIQSMLAQQKHDAYVVNIAGRQRMLSQKLSKNALAIESPSDPLGRDARRKELADVIKLWERSHLGLQLGDDKLELPGENSVQVRRMFAAIEPMHREMLSAAKSLAGSSEPQAIARQVRVILENEARFLPGMDQIVFQYSSESSERVERVARLEALLLAVTLLVLALEGVFIFRPAVVRLRRTIEELWDTEDRLRREKANVERLLASSQKPPPVSTAPPRVKPIAVLGAVKG
jgi:nitrate/nitrite-specific signal transduction histidine kinase